MADEKDDGAELPKATALARPPAAPPRERGIVLDPRVLAVGGSVALVGVVVLGLFLWMVPNAAARESVAACRGLRGDGQLDAALCPNGQPCTLPVAAPDFTATDHTGKPVKLSELRGKVVMLNFWASWCGGCKTEKPKLQTMANELASDDFVVITVASDRNWADVLVALVDALAPGKPVPRGKSIQLPDALAAYKAALPNGTAFKVWLDPPTGDDTIGPITHAWGIKAVPESALIDRKGNIQAYFVNKRDWESPVAQTCLRAVIDK
ncbi:MAG: TlpA family protein disulfide reductase [Deltaproteobacteria bacterium]|nr:TlpA family protein disulfide reductase [Deltaproteobacteria bacterium]